MSSSSLTLLPSSNRATCAARRTAAAALLLGVLLAGCGSSGSKDASATTVGTASTTMTASGATSSGTFRDYFPHEVGDTWVYRLSGSVTDTATEKITAVDRQRDGSSVVTMSYHSQAHPNFDHATEYLLYADGRLGILPQNIDFADGRQLKAGFSAVTYPSLEDLRAGRSATGTITAPLGKSTTDTISLPWTVQGEGMAKVTVPFGTFDTLAVRESLGPEASFGTTYYAKGVGGVKVEEAGSLTELISFTAAKG